MIDPSSLLNQFTTHLDQNLNTWLNDQVFNNSFLTAGIFTVITSGLLYTLRHIPGTIWNNIKHRLSFEITINNDNPHFFDFNQELNKNSINFLSRHRVLDKSELTVGYGRSVSKIGNHFCFVDRKLIDSQSYSFKEQIHLVFPFLTKKRLDKIFSNFIETKLQKETLSVYSSPNFGCIQKDKEIHKRKRNSLYFDDDVLDGLEKKLSIFENSKDWYHDHGIPYKLGILLYGPPGTGKTTLAKYIASYTNRSILTIEPAKIPHLSSMLSSKEENDDLHRHQLREKYIVLIEDIDTSNHTKSRKKNAHSREDQKEVSTSTSLGNSSIVSLGSILNGLDGVNSPEDIIFVATTNHIDQLDEALIRKGRFDECMHIDLLNDHLIKKMIQDFCGDVDFGDKVFAPVSGAELQDLILTYQEDSSEVVSRLKQVSCP